MDADKIINPLQNHNDINNLLNMNLFERTRSCCEIDDKFCNTDIWRGNMEALIKSAFRAGIIFATNKQETE